MEKVADLGFQLQPTLLCEERLSASRVVVLIALLQPTLLCEERLRAFG